MDRTFDLCDRVLADKGIQASNIDEIILVGGQSRMPLVQQEIARHFGKPPRKGVHPDESVALGAALLADSLGNIDAVTLLDALSMPIGFAMSNGRFRKIIDKNSVIPLTTSFRLPGPREDSPTIELDIFQGDSEFIVDNEYLGTVKVPASAAGRRIDFRLNEECLLEVVVELSSGPRHVALATRDTPDTLKRALAEERAARARPPAGPTAQADSGLFRSIRRILGGTECSSAVSHPRAPLSLPGLGRPGDGALQRRPRQRGRRAGVDRRLRAGDRGRAGKAARGLRRLRPRPRTGGSPSCGSWSTPTTSTSSSPSTGSAPRTRCGRALLQGTVDPVQAIVQRKLRVDGDVQPILERMRYKDVAARVLSRLETQFPDG